MFTQVLRESEHFIAVLARKGLLAAVYVVVTFEGELCRESFAAARMLTDKYADGPRRILGIRTALRHILIIGLCVLNAHVVIHLLWG